MFTPPPSLDPKNIYWGVRGHKRMGRVSFRGHAVSCPNNFFHCFHVNQVVLPEYYPIFLPKNGYLNNSRGAAPWAVSLCQGVNPPSPPLDPKNNYEENQSFFWCEYKNKATTTLLRDLQNSLEEKKVDQIRPKNNFFIKNNSTLSVQDFRRSLFFFFFNCLTTG